MVLPFAFTAISASSAVYYVETDYDSTEGRVSVQDSYTSGKTVRCYVYPDTGYTVDTVIVKNKSNNKTITSTSNYSGGVFFTMPASDVVISVTFAALDGEHETYLSYDESMGYAYLSQNGADKNDFVDIIIEPDDGYKLDYVEVINDNTNRKVTNLTEIDYDDGVYTYRFRMPDAPVTIYVEFVSRSGSDEGDYEITIGYNESRGEAWTSTDYADGKKIVYIYTDANSGYYVNSIQITSKNGTKDGDVACYGSEESDFYFIMPEDDVDIYVYFYKGTGSSSETGGRFDVIFEEYSEDCGEIWTNKSSADYNEFVYLYYTVVEGVELKEFSIVDENGNDVEYTFNGAFHVFRMPRSDVFIDVEFEGEPLFDSDGTEYPVTVVYNEEFGDAYTIEEKYEYGETVRVYVDPVKSSAVEAVIATKANGSPITGVRKATNGDYYTFKMPASNVTVTVIFTGDDSSSSSTTTSYYDISYDCNPDYGDIEIADTAKAGRKVEFTVIDGYVDEVRVINLSTGRDVTVKEGDYDGDYYFTMPSADVFVDVIFDDDVAGYDYNVDIDDYKTSQGEVTVSTPYADANDRVKIYVQPKAGYEVGSVAAYRGSKKVTTRYINDYCYYFTMPTADVEIRVTFTKAESDYEITASYTSSQGTVTLSDETAYAGDAVDVTVTPKAGYKIKSVTAKKTNTTTSVTLKNEGNGSYSFTMPSADVTVSAVFEAEVVEYTITNLSDASFGTATVAAKSEKNKAVTITATPKTGYGVNVVTVTDANNKPVTVTKKSATQWSFTMPASNVKVNVTFGKAAHVCPAAAFTDIVSTEWYHDAVDYVVSAGIMNGMSATTFAPAGTVTRAMVTTVLWRIAGQPKSTATITYTDVAAGEWYAEAVRWAAANGILTNVSNSSKLEPNATITREQFATMIYRFEQYKAGNTLPKPANNISKYSDAGKISPFAVDALNWCTANKVINGNDNGTVDPQGSTTRAQLAQILYNYKSFN